MVKFEYTETSFSVIIVGSYKVSYARCPLEVSGEETHQLEIWNFTFNSIQWNYLYTCDIFGYTGSWYQQHTLLSIEHPSFHFILKSSSQRAWVILYIDLMIYYRIVAIVKIIEVFICLTNFCSYLTHQILLGLRRLLFNLSYNIM